MGIIEHVLQDTLINILSPEKLSCSIGFLVFGYDMFLNYDASSTTHYYLFSIQHISVMVSYEEFSLQYVKYNRYHPGT